MQQNVRIGIIRTIWVWNEFAVLIHFPVCEFLFPYSIGPWIWNLKTNQITWTHISDINCWITTETFTCFKIHYCQCEKPFFELKSGVKSSINVKLSFHFLSWFFNTLKWPEHETKIKFSWHSEEKIEIKQWIGEYTTAEKYSGYVERTTARSCL